MIDDQNTTALHPDQARVLSVPAATETPDLRQPNITDRNSWVIGRQSLSILSRTYQQPARKSFRQIVPGIAGGHLSGLNQEELDITQASVLQGHGLLDGRAHVQQNSFDMQHREPG